MNLSEYIRQLGPADFAAKFGVTERAAVSWLYETRRPRLEIARRIVADSPVTWAGINGEERANTKASNSRLSA